MPVFETLALQCAPAIALDLLAAFIAVESGFDALAITAGGVRQTHASAGQAVAGAVSAGQDSAETGVGLAGVRFGDLAALGLSVGEAFDACQNLRAFEVVVQSWFGSAARRGLGPGASDKFVIRASWRPDGRFVSSEALEKAVQAERERVGVHAKTIVRGAVEPAPAAPKRVAVSTAKPGSASAVNNAVVAGPVTPSERERPGASWRVYAGDRAAISPSVLIFSKQPEAVSK